MKESKNPKKGVKIIGSEATSQVKNDVVKDIISGTPPFEFVTPSDFNKDVINLVGVTPDIARKLDISPDIAEQLYLAPEIAMKLGVSSSQDKRPATLFVQPPGRSGTWVELNPQEAVADSSEMKKDDLNKQNKNVESTENDTANKKKDYFEIVLEKPADTESNTEIKFNVNHMEDIDIIPDNLIELYSLCEEAYSVIKAMPIILNRSKVKENDIMISTKNKEKKDYLKKHKIDEERKIRNKYICDLYGISQVGLQGKSPQPKLAKKSLYKLKEEILMKEGGKIKNRHFVELGIKALIIGLIAAALGCIFLQFAKGAIEPFMYFKDNNIYPYLFIFAGAMAGTWVSFGVRNLDMTFRDLAVMEEDMLKSFPRLFFVGVVSIIFMLFIDSAIVTFDIGGIGTSDIMGKMELQILVGVIAGLLGNRLASGLYGKANDAIKFGEEK